MPQGYMYIFQEAYVMGVMQVGHPRSFSKRSTAISLFLAAFYLAWIVTCSHFNGVFPYPFLNKMPWPQVNNLPG